MDLVARLCGAYPYEYRSLQYQNSAIAPLELYDAKYPYQTLTFLFLKVTQPTFSPQIGPEPENALQQHGRQYQLPLTHGPVSQPL